jgi:hypothetical protein
VRHAERSFRRFASARCNAPPHRSRVSGPWLGQGVQYRARCHLQKRPRHRASQSKCAVPVLRASSGGSGDGNDPRWVHARRRAGTRSRRRSGAALPLRACVPRRCREVLPRGRAHAHAQGRRREPTGAMQPQRRLRAQNVSARAPLPAAPPSLSHSPPSSLLSRSTLLCTLPHAAALSAPGRRHACARSSLPRTAGPESLHRCGHYPSRRLSTLPAALRLLDTGHSHLHHRRISHERAARHHTLTHSSSSSSPLSEAAGAHTPSRLGTSQLAKTSTSWSRDGFARTYRDLRHSCCASSPARSVSFADLETEPVAA